MYGDWPLKTLSGWCYSCNVVPKVEVISYQWKTLLKPINVEFLVPLFSCEAWLNVKSAGSMDQKWVYLVTILVYYVDLSLD